MHQRRSQLNALLVAQAQLLHLVIAVRRHTEAFDPGPHRSFGHRRRLAMQPRQVDQLLTDLHLRVEPPFFWHVPDAPPAFQIDRPAIPSDLAPVSGKHPEHDSHRGGLACSVAADEAKQLASVNVEGHFPQRNDIPVSLGDCVNLQPAGHPRPSGS